MSHTPAVSIQILGNSIYNRYMVNVGTGAVLVNTSVARATKRVTRQRPISVHTPRYPDGSYRIPSAWIHNGGSTWASTYMLRQVGAIRETRSNEGGYWIPDSITSAVLQPAQDSAIQKAIAGLGDNVRQMNVFFREAQQVLNLAKAFGNGVQSGLDNLIDLNQKSWVARRDMKKFLRHGWKEAPSFYLGYLFGLEPLADDLTNAVNTLNDLRDTDEEISLVVRGKSKNVIAYDAQLQPVVADVRYWVPIRRTVVGRCSLRFVMPISKLGALQFVTPFSQAWETTRLSFVLDYFLPIGPWLSAIEGCQIAPFFRDGTVSTKVTDTPSDEGYVVASSMPQVYSVVAGGEVNSYQRNVLNGFPYESVFRPPRFRLPGIKQLGVMAALIGQRLTTLSKVIKR